MNIRITCITAVALFCAGSSPAALRPFEIARQNSFAASEGFERSVRMVEAWMKHSDESTGLIPRNLNQRQWVVKDSAADNFPFWVLAAWYTDRSLYYGPMHDILQAEIRLTNRLDRLPDDYDFDTRGFVFPEVDPGRINHLAEWYSLESDRLYEVKIEGGPEKPRRFSGRQLIEGLELNAGAGSPVRLTVRPR